MKVLALRQYIHHSANSDVRPHPVAAGIGATRPPGSRRPSGTELTPEMRGYRDGLWEGLGT